jgi:hypothetical protein
MGPMVIKFHLFIWEDFDKYSWINGGVNAAVASSKCLGGGELAETGAVVLEW